MIIRKITEDEFLRADEISCVAFEWPISKKTKEERLRDIKENPSSHPEKYALMRFAAFTDEGDMMGSIGAFPYTINFDGHTMGMSGIGGVSTLPEYRRQGVVRGCFEAAFADMKEKHLEFSFLYPFSTVYYRQFGYEVGPEIAEWKINFKAIPTFPEVKGKCHLYRVGESLEEYHKVYRDFSKAYNLSIVREDIDFAVMTKNPAETNKYLYLYTNEAGEPKGYMAFHKEYADNDRIMNCGSQFHNVEFFFSDIEGLKGLLNFTKAFAADYDTLLLSLPLSFPLQLYLGEANFVKRSVHFRGMIRVVDVLPVLQKAAYLGSGEIKIGISDRFAPWNEGCFHVIFKDGRAVSVNKTEEAADISMGIGDFSRLIAGCFDRQEIDLFPNIIISNNTPAISQIFYKKKNWFGDFF